MYCQVLFLSIFCLLNTCVGEVCEKDCSKPDPCNPDDEPCIAAIVDHYASPVLSKIVRDSFAKYDCMTIDRIPGNFSIMKYHATNNTVSGLKSCNLTKINISPDVSAAQFVFECPAYVISGEYELCGYYLYIPVIGCGKYENRFGQYCITVYATIQRVKGCEGKTHLQLSDFSVDVKALSPIKYKLENMYHGNAYLTKIANDFSSCHWKEMSIFTDGPVWNRIIKEVFTLCNKKLLRLSAEKLFMCQ